MHNLTYYAIYSTIHSYNNLKIDMLSVVLARAG